MDTQRIKTPRFGRWALLFSVLGLGTFAMFTFFYVLSIYVNPSLCTSDDDKLICKAVFLDLLVFGAAPMTVVAFLVTAVGGVIAQDQDRSTGRWIAYGCGIDLIALLYMIITA